MDLAALLWFFACWIGFALFADVSRWRAGNVTEAMNRYRYEWMTQMYQRELKMIDTLILGNLLNGIAFYASTAILIVGGLGAALGASDKAVEVLSDLPFATTTTQAVWEVKVLLLIVIFIYAFIKFAWSFRLSNYCSILIGASPHQPVSEQEAKRLAHRPARMANLVGVHFNRGLRAYFFALAVLWWFVHPLLFIISTTTITLILYRREFRSRSLRVLTDNRSNAIKNPD